MTGEDRINKKCECGCGLPAPIARKTDRRSGSIKDQPVRFIHNHDKRDPMPFARESRGYPTACWIFQGFIGPNGYGKTGHRWAHRRAYEERYGPVPAGLEIDHLCRVRSCINPDHLEPVTGSENARRGLTGEHNRKLSLEDVARIKTSDEPGIALAAQFGVTPTRISQIRRAA